MGKLEGKVPVAKGTNICKRRCARVHVCSMKADLDEAVLQVGSGAVGVAELRDLDWFYEVVRTAAGITDILVANAANPGI